MSEKKENLLKTKEIFDKMLQAALEGSEYTFTEENIAIEYYVFVSIFKKSGIEPSLVNFHSLKYLFFEDNKVNFRCANKKDFYISPWNMWEDQNDFYENYLDELTITFDNLFK